MIYYAGQIVDLLKYRVTEPMDSVVEYTIVSNELSKLAYERSVFYREFPSRNSLRLPLTKTSQATIHQRRAACKPHDEVHHLLLPATAAARLHLQEGLEAGVEGV